MQNMEDVLRGHYILQRRNLQSPVHVLGAQRPSLARTESHGYPCCRGDWESEILAQVMREKEIWNGYWDSQGTLPLILSLKE